VQKEPQMRLKLEIIKLQTTLQKDGRGCGGSRRKGGVAVQGRRRRGRVTHKTNEEGEAATLSKSERGEREQSRERSQNVGLS